VGGHDHRHALGLELAEQVQDLADQLRVQRAGHLVEQHQPRRRDQRPRDRHALLLTTGELVRVRVGPRRQPDALEHRPGEVVGVAARHPVDQPGRQGDVVEHAHVREQVEGLEHHPHPCPDGVGVLPWVGDVLAVEQDDAVVDVLQEVDGPQEGGLARPGRPDQDDAPVRVHVEVDAVQHDVRAERLAHALHPQERLSRGQGREQSPGHRSAPAPASPPVAPAQPPRRASASVNRVSGIVSSTNSTPATT
jgi:hypothetical protein